jgi:hypothetical protein
MKTKLCKNKKLRSIVFDSVRISFYNFNDCSPISEHVSESVYDSTWKFIWQPVADCVLRSVCHFVQDSLGDRKMNEKRKTY